ncbi:MAG TPA: hypothetical protein VGF20_06645 [Candidatus Acidoferrum sp.]|jgi:ElaB/YqjD/DUF883 family membrane-anchored ribosome-binding protein
MDEFNNNETKQTPYWQPENGVAGNTGTGTAARMKRSDSIDATDVKEKVAELGRRTVDKIDDSRQSAAAGLDATASRLHSSGQQLSGAAHTAADKLHATADYVRQNDLKAMADDVQEIMKKYPVHSLAAAAILGFLVARGLRNIG